MLLSNSHLFFSLLVGEVPVLLLTAIVLLLHASSLAAPVAATLHKALTLHVVAVERLRRLHHKIGRWLELNAHIGSVVARLLLRGSLLLKLGRVGRLLRTGLVTERQTMRLKTLAALTILLLLILKRRGNKGKIRDLRIACDRTYYSRCCDAAAWAG